VLPLTCLFAWCTLPLLSPNTKVNPLFQNLATNIVEVQTLGGILLLGGDFNARTIVLSNTIATSDLCELLHAPKLVETK
jgi:hypothetical protein